MTSCVGAFLAGVFVTLFVVFLLTRIAKKKYEVVEREPPSGSGGGGGSRPGDPPRNLP